MSKWSEIPLVAALGAMLEEKDKRERAEAEGKIKGSLTVLPKESVLEALKKLPLPDSLCTSEATVICSNAIEESEGVHIVANSEVYLGGKRLLTRTDVQPENNFSGCIKAKDGRCRIAENYRDWILDDEWKAYDSSSGQGVGKEMLSREYSYMLCEEYCGVIHFLDDGQSTEAFLDNLTEEAAGRDDKDPMITWLKNMEGPYLDRHFVIVDKIRVGIKPHNVNDGYITIGYGHIIQTQEEALHYGFEIEEKYVDEKGNLKRMPKEVVDAVIEKQQKIKGMSLGNKANLSFRAAENILVLDWEENKEKVKEIIGDNLLQNEHKLNALTSLYFNGSQDDNEDSLFNTLRNQENEDGESEEEKYEKATRLLHEAEENNWYGENQGLLRRRLMEVNIYFNQDYTFYDSSEIEELKKRVGY